MGLVGPRAKWSGIGRAPWSCGVLFRMLWPLAIRQWCGAKGIQHGAHQLPSAETEHENAQWSQPLPLPISSSKKWLM